MAEVQKIKFLDAFSEDKDDILTLRVKLQVSGQNFNIEDTFRKGEKLAGVDFHVLRYFDLAVEPLTDNVYKVTGFFPQK